MAEHEITINGNTYRIKQYMFSRRSQLLWKLAKILGDGAAAILNGILEGKSDVFDAEIDFGNALKEFLKNIDPEQHTGFIKETIRNLTVFPKKIQDADGFEMYFSDNFADHIPLFIEIIKYNLASVASGELKKKYLSYMTAMAEPSRQAEQVSTPV